MTDLVIHLPNDLEERARRAGLLSDGAIQALLEDAIRGQAGWRLREVVESIHAADVAPMTMEEIDTEVKAVRADRRARETRDRGADRS